MLSVRVAHVAWFFLVPSKKKSPVLSHWRKHSGIQVGKIYIRKDNLNQLLSLKILD